MHAPHLRITRAGVKEVELIRRDEVDAAFDGRRGVEFDVGKTPGFFILP
jgi:hypothetical protein